ncbi:MAG: TatD family hydrolase [Planctomycetota bacterium]|jgi:TatD DNase family protein
MNEASKRTGNAPPLLIDTHAHLELEPLVRDPEGVVSRAFSQGVRGIITVGIDLNNAQTALSIARRFDGVFASMGFHPHNASRVTDSGLEAMERLARHPEVKAYGEIGLDFFRNRSPRAQQESVFAEQLSLAKKLAKPVIIHFRDSYRTGLEMLEAASPFPEGGVIHCFSGSQDDAQRTLDLGFHLSFPGTVTYRKNTELRSIARSLPENRFLLETDCPFLPPEPFRGKVNEPCLMIHTARKLAEIRGISLEEVARLTTENAIRLFHLPERL